MKIISLLIIIVIPVSCGGGKGKIVENSLGMPSAKPNLRDSFTQIDRDKRLVEKIDEYYVSCERPMECPGYMSMLAIEFKGEVGFHVGRCSSFLVSSEVLATNAHCIPNDLKGGDSCIDRIFALFPESKDKGPDRVGCEKILSKFRDEDLGYDYAFIKLDRKVDREIPEIDFGMRSSEIAITIWKVDPFDYNFGMVRKGTCQLFKDSFFYSDFHSPFSPSLSFSGCESNLGNSGSPLLNSEGKIIGINWGATENYRPEIDPFRDLIPDRHLEFLHFGTNFGCLCKKGDSYTNQCENLPESCCNRDLAKVDYYQNSLLKKKAKEFLTDKEFSFLEGLKEGFSGNSIEWDFGFLKGYKNIDGVIKGHKIFVSLVPKCIKSFEGLITESSELMIDGISNRFLVVPEVKVCEIDPSFNSKLQVVGMKLNSQKCFTSNFHLSFFDSGNTVEVRKYPSLNITWVPEGMEEGHDYPYSREIILKRCDILGEGTGSVAGSE